MPGETTYSAGSHRRTFFERYKWLVAFLLLLVGLVLTAYFVLTSSAVLKALVLPRVGAALNARVTADHIGLSPFSHVRIQNLQIATSGSQPVVQIHEVTVRYGLFSILRGKYVIPEITLDRPSINLEVAADGRSNFDPLMGNGTPEESRGASTTPELDLGTFVLRGGTVVYRLNDAAGTSQSSTVTNLEVTLTGLKNTGAAKLVLSGLLLQTNRGASNRLDELSARLKADLGFSLDAKLMPSQLAGSVDTEVQAATGNLSPAAGLSGRLAIDLTATELRTLTLRFQRESTALGEIRSYGPLDLSRREGRLTFQITSVGRAALALVGAPMGVDFGETAISGSGFLDLAGRGTRYTANVSLDAKEFAVRHAGGSTPALDLRFELRGNVDLEAKTGYLERLLLSGKLAGRELFTIATERALNVAWNREAPRTAAPALIGIAVNDLQLTDWRSLIGTNVLDGVVSLDAQITSDKDGRNTAVTFASFPEFSTSSFKNPVDLIARLREPVDPLSVFLREHLSAALHTGYTNYAQARNPQAQVDALRPLVQTLAHDFNKLSEKGSIYEAGRFEKTTLRPVTRKLLAEDPKGEALLRLNRLLLEDAYPQHVARSIQVFGLTVAAGTNVQRNLDLVLSGTVGITDFSVLTLERAQATCREAGVPLFLAQASATYSTEVGSGNVEANVSGDLPTLLARHPVPDIDVQRGSFRLSSLLNWNRASYSASLSALVGDVSGTFGGYRLDGYSSQFDLSGELMGERLILRRLGLTAREGTRSSGTAEIVGQVNSDIQTAQFTLNVSGLNQFALRPFLPTSFGGVDLAGITINSRGDFRYDARTRPSSPPGSLDSFQQLFESMARGQGDTSFDLAAGVTNLVLRQRASARTSLPLGFDLHLGGTRQGEVYAVATNTLRLTPTPLAQNLLTWSGRFDLSPTNPTPSTLSARSDGLDLVSLVDLYTAFTSSTNVPAAAPPTSPAPVTPEVEPPPVHLPIRQFTGDLSISNIFAREIIIKDWVARAVVDQDRITVAPFSLRIHDAPVSAGLKLDLTQPGYVYEVSLDAADVKLRPFVNSLAPAYLDQARGDIYAKVRLSGAGITGPSLQRNLSGEASLNLTNLTVQIITPRTRKLLTTLATALRIDDLANSPLTLVAAQMQIGGGSIAIRPFTAASAAFFATAEGAIQLLPVLTNSTVNLPVQLALRQDLARQVKLTNLQPAANTNFLTLPPLVKIGGTVGSPEAEIDKVRLTALLAGSLGGAIGGTTGNAIQGVGSLLQGDTGAAANALGNLLQGRKPAATNAAPARAATNAPAAGATNAPAPPTTNAPARSGVLNLLDALQKKN